MGRRRRTREVALQILYRLDLDGSVRDSRQTVPEEAIRDLLRFLAPGSDIIRNNAYLLVSGVLENRPEIDSIIENAAENWTLDRISVIDRNILRIAVFEMVFVPEIPYKVAINEAIEIAKRFSTDEAGRFINGVLDRAQQLEKARGADDNDISSEGMFTL